MTPQTYTVVSGWTNREGKHFVFLRGQPVPVPADEPLEEGAAVRIVDGRAVR